MLAPFVTVWLSGWVTINGAVLQRPPRPLCGWQEFLPPSGHDHKWPAHRSIPQSKELETVKVGALMKSGLVFASDTLRGLGLNVNTGAPST